MKNYLNIFFLNFLILLITSCQSPKYLKVNKLSKENNKILPEVQYSLKDKFNPNLEELRRDTRMHQYQGVQDPHVEIKAFAELYNSDNEAIGEADILISPTATNNPGPQIYEVKKEQADIDAVRQIFGYMKARGIKDGIIAAQTLASKAENLMKEYNNNHDVNITFWDYTQLAIFN